MRMLEMIKELEYWVLCVPGMVLLFSVDWRIGLGMGLVSTFILGRRGK